MVSDSTLRNGHPSLIDFHADMFHLWSLAEEDLLSDSIAYRLRDTGQGLNRVQPSPKTSRLMHTILHKAQKSVGSWVGSSVIHMGDHNVPNALLFIDKYTQVYRILLPICNTLGNLGALMEKPALRSFIEDEFGSKEGLAREILGDFFRHGFDGSGAGMTMIINLLEKKNIADDIFFFVDNFFDAGSCIDGRLTSAWNWCSSLEKKRFFPIFLLSGEYLLIFFFFLDCFALLVSLHWCLRNSHYDTGFIGFDGDW